MRGGGRRKANESKTMTTVAVPTAGELQNIELALNRLWHLDTNRLIAGEHVSIFAALVLT